MKSSLDWIVVAIYAIGMLAIGVYFQRKTKTTDDYMLGGRQMKSWSVGLSLFATLFSAITYLAMPGEMIKHGPMMWSKIASLPLVYGVVGWFLIPHIMKLRVSSAYELLELRLGVKIRTLASLFFLTMRLIWMAVIIFMVAEKVMVPIMGWSDETAIWVSVALGVITIGYTSLGGLRGVVLTDVIQSFILFGGTILAIILITSHFGSVAAIIPTEWPGHWAEWKFFDMNARVSFMTMNITIFGMYVCTAGSDQMSIQRYLSTRDARAARKAFLTSLLANGIVYIMLAVLGIALMSYYQANPGLLMNGESLTSAADSLLPYYIVNGFPVGISGLVFSGLLAAAMSSLSSGINSSSMVVINDFIIRFKQDKLSEELQVKWARVISVIIGFVAILLSLVMGNVKGNLIEITFKTVNLLVAPLFVPFFMALFVKRSSERAVVIGTIASALTATCISFSSELFNSVISFLWIIPASFAVGALTSYLLSYVLPKPTTGIAGN
ncbi:sodium/solute symporter [candidate division KSB1 bacterium]|nr:sodium/solute symporter [candidate division KSB1 bacterium]